MHLLRYVLMVIFYARNILCWSDLSGTKFVLSFPTFHTINRNISFLIYTLEISVNVKIELNSVFGSRDVMRERIRFEEKVTVNRNEMKIVNYWENYTFLSPTEASIPYGKGQYRYGLPRSDVSQKFSYVLAGSYSFYVTVFIIDTGTRANNLAALQAVPVEGWGRVYYAVTLSYEPSIQIMTSQENIVTINLNSPNKQIYLTYNGMVYTNKALMTIELEIDQSFSLQACPMSEFTDYGEMTGTRIEGDNPIGVVSGNCEGYLQEKCELKTAVTDSTLKAELAMEMLLPVETYGTVFLLLNAPGDNLLYSSTYVVIALRNNTHVVWGGELNVFTEVKELIRTAGDSIKVPGRRFAQFLNSTKPVSVHLVYNTGCDRVPYGDASMTTIIPTALFMDIYIWRTMDLAQYSLNVSHFVAFVCLQDDVRDGLRLDGAPLFELNRNFSSVGKWEVGEVRVQQGYHEMFSTKSAKFGAYVFGIGSDMYMYPAGFISSTLNDGKCTQDNDVTFGDFIDNDCDGWIDEEKKDNIDEDFDGRTDEDLLPLPPRNGSWSEWGPWWCFNCKATTRMRSRLCTQPAPTRGGQNCQGPSMDSKVEECGTICLMVHGSWNNWDEWSCSAQCYVVSRTRICDLPAPQNGGTFCRGPGTENKTSLDCNRSCTSSTRGDIMRSTTESNLKTEPSHVPHGGSWGEWTVWDCPHDCHVKQMQRTRECDSPPPEPGGLDCMGPPVQLTEDEMCLSTCPDDCPDGKWGLNCSKDCSHCESPCDKQKGICHSCKPGYRLPLFSCTKECDKYFYGYDCRGNCMIECDGDDCIERVKGTCPAKKTIKYWHLLSLLLLIPMAILCYLPQSYKRKFEEVTEDDGTEKVIETGSRTKLDNRSLKKSRSGIGSNLLSKTSLEKRSSRSSKSFFADEGVYGTYV